MVVFKKISTLRRYLDTQVKRGSKIGFVPTLGALHNGHMSLIELADDQTDIVVCSIFVNPTQFNEATDFEKYPITIKSDIQMLLKHSCDVVFLPGVDEIYPHGTDYDMPYDLGEIVTLWEGAHRPGHFDGVVQVVDRLLEIVQPHQLFMGQKDFQQFSIIQKVLDIKQSNTELVVCPIIREEDGLAMSSRNVRLSKEDRSTALALYKALCWIEQHKSDKSVNELLEGGLAILDHPRIKVEYLNIVDGRSLNPIKEMSDTDYPVALVTAWVGEVRLIDNFILK